jgi:hypothetical protein
MGHPGFSTSRKRVEDPGCRRLLAVRPLSVSKTAIKGMIIAM